MGTKFLTSLYCTEDGHVHDAYWGSVRDCHAEILARRSFMKYIYNNIENILQDHTSPNEIFLPIDKSILEEATGPEILHAFQLRPEVRFHFYTSSQPCGNACIKKFAKGKKPVSINFVN